MAATRNPICRAALADVPVDHACPDGVDASDRFVSWDAGELRSRQQSLDGEHVRVTDAAGLDADSHVKRVGIHEGALRELERAALRRLDDSIARHLSSSP